MSKRIGRAVQEWVARILSPLLASACFFAIALIVLSYEWPQKSSLQFGAQFLEAGALLVFWVWLTRRPDEMIVKWMSLGIVVGAVIVTYYIHRDLWSLMFDLGVSAPCLRHLLPEDRETRMVSVQASGLSGTVEYESMYFSNILVEECSSDWKQQLAQVKTGTNGYFELPRTSEEGVHYIRVSWPGTKTVHFRAQLSAGAKPLLIRLKPQKPNRSGNWGE